MTKWFKIDQDNLQAKFLPLNLDFSSPKFQPPRFNKACARERQNEVPYLKGVYFTAIGFFSVKTDADRHKRAAYHNKH